MRKLQVILLILGLSLNLNAQDVKKVYDLSGRDMTEQYNAEELHKGVYIIDGKKVTLKADQQNVKKSKDACYHQHYQKKMKDDEVIVADANDDVYSIPVKKGYERTYSKWDSFEMRLNWIGTMMILNRNNYLY
ncbi:hypothetical protein [Methanobrevibacter sp.]|uniref:hypothetical protein n=1 Tax=Methanobrevibacter sp. TaxID=66852 RepID=UPI0038703469